MNRISEVDTQKIVNQIANLSVSGRVHKKPLAQALKDVQSAAKKLAEFQPEQAKKIVEGMEKSFTVLAAQKSNMEKIKTNGLRILEGHLSICFSYSMGRTSESIAGFRQKQANLPALARHEKTRIESQHQGKIDRLKNYLSCIQESYSRREVLLEKRNELDTTFHALLAGAGFSENEREVAIRHYERPTTREIKGLDHHSSEDIFSDKEAYRRFGGDITQHMEYGRRQYVEIPTKRYQPANAEGRAWVQFRRLAEQRRQVDLELYRHPPQPGAGYEQAILGKIKAEKVAWNADLKTLQTIVTNESAHLRTEIVKASDQLSSLQEAHDELLQKEYSTSL